MDSLVPAYLVPVRIHAGVLQVSAGLLPMLLILHDDVTLSPLHFSWAQAAKKMYHACRENPTIDSILHIVLPVFCKPRHLS